MTCDAMAAILRNRYDVITALGWFNLDEILVGMCKSLVTCTR